MNQPELEMQLAALSVEHAQGKEQVQQELRALRRSRENLRQEIVDLQRRLDGLARQQAELTAALDAAEQDFATRTRDAAVEALAAGQSAIQVALSDALAHDRLAAERAELLAANPELAERLSEYRRFEVDKDKILASLPETYRAPLVASHAELHSQVLPLLQLEGRLAQAAAPPTVSIDCLLSVNDDTADLSLVFPIHMHDLTGEEPDGEPWRRLAQMLQEALFAMGKRPEWVLVGNARSAWCGFLAIETLAEYSGAEDIEAACARAIEQYLLAQETLLLLLAPQVVSIPAPAWQAGVRTELDGEPELAVTGVRSDGDVSVVGPDSDDETPSDIEISSAVQEGWYVDDDVKSWRQPLNVSAESKWTQPARQLRTLLMRMVAQGKLGADHTPLGQLWAGLPDPYAARSAAFAERLLELGLLLAHEVEGEASTVSLNPEMLDEVQDLINRTVTPFWEELVAVQA